MLSNACGGSTTSITNHYLPALLMNYRFLIFPCCSLMRAGSFSVTAVCDCAERDAHYSFKDTSKCWAFLTAIYAPHPVGSALILAMSSISHACSTS